MALIFTHYHPIRVAIRVATDASFPSSGIKVIDQAWSESRRTKGCSICYGHCLFLQKVFLNFMHCRSVKAKTDKVIHAHTFPYVPISHDELHTLLMQMRQPESTTIILFKRSTTSEERGHAFLQSKKHASTIEISLHLVMSEYR